MLVIRAESAANFAGKQNVMTAYTCCTCGVQYEPSQSPPAVCKICSDDRQYIGSGGQQWTTLQQINKQYKNIIEQVAEGVYAIYTAQPFAIGQRAHLVLSPSEMCYGIV
jgi:hypothetical protein